MPGTSLSGGGSISEGLYEGTNGNQIVSQLLLGSGLAFTGLPGKALWTKKNLPEPGSSGPR